MFCVRALQTLGIMISVCLEHAIYLGRYDNMKLDENLRRQN
jgi:hypothetical protein